MEKLPVDKLGSSKQFLFDTYQFLLETKITEFSNFTEEKTQACNLRIILESTIYHPQGGGQPADKGKLVFLKQSEAIQIDSVYIDKDTDKIIHIIKKPEFEICIGDVVKIEIDADWRKLNARNHTSGHLIDIIMREQQPTWGAGKGYHFPDSPYVEYNLPSAADASQLEKIKDILNQECNNLIQNLPAEDGVITKVVDFDEASKLVKVPEFLKGKELRLVKINSKDWWGLCGGTHVKHIKEIGSLIISKVQKKGKRVRVQYNVS